MTIVHFRLATTDDFGAVFTLMREYYAHDHLAFNESAAAKALQQLLHMPEWGRVWLIEAGTEIVGYVVLCLGYSLEYHGRDAFVDEIYLRAAFRGLGLGKHALQFVEEECRKLGVQALHLEVERANTNAHEVYRKHGFVDHDRYLMTKPIAIADAE